MTPNDLKMTSNELVENKKKSLKVGAIIEFNEKCLIEIIQNNYLEMHLAIQITFIDQKVKSETVQDLKDFNSQFLATQAKKENS